jgi:uncharacterized membrane protein YhaH (DUF805 family)
MAGQLERDDMREPSRTGLEYLRRLYANLLDWYKVADARAQLILTLDGIFIAIVTGTVFAKPDELGAWKRVFGLDTWMFLSFAAFAIVGSMISALACLHSRLHEATLNFVHQCYQVNPDKIETYVPGVAWWYGMIAAMDRRLMIRYLQTSDDAFEIEALANQIVLLSGRILRKHQWANRGWLLAAFSLLFLLAAGASYVLRA